MGGRGFCTFPAGLNKESVSLTAQLAGGSNPKVFLVVEFRVPKHYRVILSGVHEECVAVQGGDLKKIRKKLLASTFELSFESNMQQHTGQIHPRRG